VWVGIAYSWKLPATGTRDKEKGLNNGSIFPGSGLRVPRVFHGKGWIVPRVPRGEGVLVK